MRYNSFSGLAPEVNPNNTPAILQFDIQPKSQTQKYIYIVKIYKYTSWKVNIRISHDIAGSIKPLPKWTLCVT